MIKNIVKNLKPSATLRMNEESKKFETQETKIFKFGFGQSPFQIPKDIVDELKNNAYQNKYLPMQGLPELRSSISRYINNKKKYNYVSENVIIGPGTKELMFLLHVLFDGDVILPVPSWVSYAPQAIIGRNKIHWLETTSSNNWFPTAESLEKIISKNKNKNYLLFLNSPNNPSGQICNNLEEISVVAKKNNLIILSDEIYSELSFKKDFKSIANYCPEKTIISNGMSKWCGAGGWRLGFFIIPESLNEIKNSLKTLASETFSSVNAPAQYAAIAAYENNHDEYIDNSKNILKAVGEYVYDNLKSNKVSINKPEGGFYLMPEFSNETFSDSNEMCGNLLKHTGISLLPGSVFGFSKKKMTARLSFTDFNGQEFMKNISQSQKIDQNVLLKYAPKIIEGVDKLKNWSESI